MNSAKNSFLGWLLVLPAAALLTLFTFLPIVASILQSFYSKERPRRPSQFVGFDNYEAMIADPVFWKALTNNFVYVLGTVPTSIAIAVAMALIVNSRIGGKGLLRMAYFTPTVMPMIAVANIWIFFFTPDYGLLERALAPFGLAGNNWLGSSDSAMICVILVAIWKEAGFFMIFYLAALQQISPDLYEAAAIEGANRWTTFWRITVPLLMPTTLFVVVNALVNAFRVVDQIVVMTNGGPNNATSVLLFRLYEVGFKYFDTGVAAAMTVVLLGVMAVIAVGNFLVLDSRIHYR